MFNEWQLYQKLTKIRIENDIQEPEVVPFFCFIMIILKWMYLPNHGNICLTSLRNIISR